MSLHVLHLIHARISSWNEQKKKSFIRISVSFNFIIISYEFLIENSHSICHFLFSQVSLVMDPAHLIAPPRAHPSGISSNESIHSRNILNETWFMVIMAIVLVSLLVFAAFTLRFLYRRRKNLSKGLQHLSGECWWLLNRIRENLIHEIYDGRKYKF